MNNSYYSATAAIRTSALTQGMTMSQKVLCLLKLFIRKNWIEECISSHLNYSPHIDVCWNHRWVYAVIICYNYSFSQCLILSRPPYLWKTSSRHKYASGIASSCHVISLAYRCNCFVMSDFVQKTYNVWLSLLWCQRNQFCINRFIIMKVLGI